MKVADDIVYADPPIRGLRLLSCRNEHHFASHFHDGYVLWLNSASAEKYSLKGAGGILQPGSVSIIAPGVVHANSPGTAGDRHLHSFYFSETFTRYLAKALTGKEQQRLFEGSGVVDDFKLWRKLTALHEALVQNGDSLGAECSTLSIFGDVVNALGKSFPQVSSVTGERKRSHRVVDYFHSHLAEDISLERLADLCSCSSFHLIRIFRREYGLSPYAYLVQLRLENARRMLEERYSIADASYSSGFSDQSHLTRKFKLRYGITPGAYRRQKLGGRQGKMQKVNFVQD